MIRLAISALMVLLTLGAATSAAEVYKWTDDSGVLQYTQMPPEDRPFQPVRQQRSPTPPSAPATAAGSEPESSAVESGDAVMTAAAGSMAEAKQKNCELARRNAEVLSTKTTILMSDPASGEERKLSEEERQQQLEQAERDAGYYCE
jgi:hypothetical protein